MSNTPFIGKITQLTAAAAPAAPGQIFSATVGGSYGNCILCHAVIPSGIHACPVEARIRQIVCEELAKGATVSEPPSPASK